MLRTAPLLLILASAGLLAGAFAFQVFGGLDPCPLCLWQRWSHATVVPLALLALFLDRAAQHTLAGLALLATAATLAVGAGIALFHVGVEHGWWQGLAACSAVPTGPTVAELALGLNNRPAACDQVAWSLLGLSMAGYNAILSVALALCAVLAAGVRLTTGRSLS